LFCTHCIKTMQNALFHWAEQASLLSAVILTNIYHNIVKTAIEQAIVTFTQSPML
jgi:hypothetical protein